VYSDIHTVHSPTDAHFQFRGSVHHTMIIEKHQLDAAR